MRAYHFNFSRVSSWTEIYGQRSTDTQQGQGLGTQMPPSAQKSSIGKTTSVKAHKKRLPTKAPSPNVVRNTKESEIKAMSPGSADRFVETLEAAAKMAQGVARDKRAANRATLGIQKARTPADRSAAAGSSSFQGSDSSSPPGGLSPEDNGDLQVRQALPRQDKEEVRTPMLRTRGKATIQVEWEQHHH